MMSERCGGAPGKPNWKHPESASQKYKNWHAKEYACPQVCHPCPGCGDCGIVTAVNVSPGALACAEEICKSIRYAPLGAPGVGAGSATIYDSHLIASLISRFSAVKDAKIEEAFSLLRRVLDEEPSKPDTEMPGRKVYACCNCEVGNDHDDKCVMVAIENFLIENRADALAQKGEDGN